MLGNSFSVWLSVNTVEIYFSLPVKKVNFYNLSIFLTAKANNLNAAVRRGIKQSAVYLQTIMSLQGFYFLVLQH